MTRAMNDKDRRIPRARYGAWTKEHIQGVKPSDRCVDGLQIVYIARQLRYRLKFDVRTNEWGREASQIKDMLVRSMETIGDYLAYNIYYLIH
jgi:hypothetical protein